MKNVSILIEYDVPVCALTGASIGQDDISGVFIPLPLIPIFHLNPVVAVLVLHISASLGGLLAGTLIRSDGRSAKLLLALFFLPLMPLFDLSIKFSHPLSVLTLILG
ncbi:hypothetical protein ACI2L1_23065 [Streptomyces sp. NPDC019531]|uniref:hypothetical protein n=1 Tax=Streptomyces sp. NPDC019531 TaxID=3365062 RepID=UPI0038508F4D